MAQTAPGVLKDVLNHWLIFGSETVAETPDTMFGRLDEDALATDAKVLGPNHSDTQAIAKSLQLLLERKVSK